MKVVLDTNVLLSAVFTRGVCEALLDTILESETISIVLSEHILREFTENAVRKFGVPPGEAASAAAFLRQIVDVVEPATVSDSDCPDPDDLAVLGTAIAASADALVTGDGELLALREINRIPIVSPRRMLDGLQ